jgi:hypothetical protein
MSAMILKGKLDLLRCAKPGLQKVPPEQGLSKIKTYGKDV